MTKELNNKMNNPESSEMTFDQKIEWLIANGILAKGTKFYVEAEGHMVNSPAVPEEVKVRDWGTRYTYTGLDSEYMRGNLTTEEWVDDLLNTELEERLGIGIGKRD